MKYNLKNPNPTMITREELEKFGEKREEYQKELMKSIL